VPVTHAATSANDNRVHSIDEPTRTITGANRGELALVQPYVTSYYGEGEGGQDRSSGIDQPLLTQTTANRFALVAPTMVQTGYGERPGQAPRSLDLQQPLGTVVGCGQRHALVSAFLAKHFGDRPTGGWAGGSDLADRIGTVTTQDHHSLVTSNLVKLRGTSDEHMDGSSLGATDQVPTISAGGTHVGEVRAFLTKYYGQSDAEGMDTPMGTLTTKERFGLVTVNGQDYQISDIGMRMLTPRELFRAQGFPDTYKIDIKVKKWVMVGRKNPRREQIEYTLSTKAQVRMVGNSVSPYVAAALVKANYAPQVYARDEIAAAA
jgi:DNA (cytosine-5)-methyltransferase 1